MFNIKLLQYTMFMKIHILNSGNFKLDGGAMFGVVPKSIWSRSNPADNNNMCSWAMRCLLIEIEDKKILIDTGIGDKQSEKFFNYFYLHGKDTLLNSLKELSIKCEDITHVLFTHLHFDHCGGAIKRNKNKLELVFKNAVHLTNLEHWEEAHNPNAREKASFLRENFDLINEKNKLQFIEMGELFKNISVRFFYGHTKAQIIPIIKYKGHSLVFMADLLPSIGHIPLPYVMGYDSKPLITLKEKDEFLKEAADKNYILLLQHDYNYEYCTVKHSDNRVILNKYGKLRELFI